MIHSAVWINVRVGANLLRDCIRVRGLHLVGYFISLPGTLELTQSSNSVFRCSILLSVLRLSLHCISHESEMHRVVIGWSMESKTKVERIAIEVTFYSTTRE